MSSGQQPWIAGLLQHALAQKWCMKPGCTTCGAMFFRAAIVARAATSGGIEPDEPRLNAGGEQVGPLLQDISTTKLPAYVETIAAGLRQLAPDDVPVDRRTSKGLQILLYEWQRAARTADMDPDELLAGCWAGRNLNAI